MAVISDYEASSIRFDVDKEQRQSIEDSRQLICIDIDKVGTGYRAIINGCEFELPAGIGCADDARRIAIQVAVRELNVAAGELLAG